MTDALRDSVAVLGPGALERHDLYMAAMVAQLKRELERDRPLLSNGADNAFAQAAEAALLRGEAVVTFDSQPAKYHGAVRLMGDSEALYLGTLLVESRR